jgi:hypothetical protein
MAKTSTLNTFIQTYGYTFHNRFQGDYHNIQIWPLIFDISSDFSSQLILIKQLY